MINLQAATTIETNSCSEQLPSFNEKMHLFTIQSPMLFSYRWLPLAEFINVLDVNVVMATIAAALMDDDRKQLIGEIRVLSISL